MSVLQAPSLVLGHLARRKDNYWRSRNRHLWSPRNSSLDRARKLSTCDRYNKDMSDNGGDKRKDSLNFLNNPRHPYMWELHDFKNGRNISVAEYLNIETKYVQENDIIPLWYGCCNDASLLLT